MIFMIRTDLSSWKKMSLEKKKKKRKGMSNNILCNNMSNIITSSWTKTDGNHTNIICFSEIFILIVHGLRDSRAFQIAWPSALMNQHFLIGVQTIANWRPVRVTNNPSNYVHFSFFTPERVLIQLLTVGWLRSSLP